MTDMIDCPLALTIATGVVIASGICGIFTFLFLAIFGGL